MILCSPLEKDVVKIAGTLADVEDWERLAGSLNINSMEIWTDCAHHPSPAMCRRRKLVRRYCDSQQSGSPRVVAEDIAAELGRMGCARQGANLRNAFSLGELRN